MDQDKEQEFLNHLREEKLQTQDLRTKYVFRKLTFVISLLGLGSIKIASYDFTTILYIIPFISIGFDLYILGEDYSVKRIGAFLNAISSSKTEVKWEEYVSGLRDPFAPFAMPFLTIVVIIICGIIFFTVRKPNHFILHILWFAIPIAFSVSLYYMNKILRTKAKEKAKTKVEEMKAES
ncbi:MAG: hypothetical protein ACUZ77_08020 [Candidatus Brocadiales bacterium]